MFSMKKTILVAAVSAALSPLAAQAELTANIGATSNYMWRGVTQTADGAAVSGGVDWADPSGFYAGTWASNVDFADYEWDLYAGFGGGSGDISWDFNTIVYVYDDGCGDCNFWEVGASVGYQWFTAGLQYTIDGEQPDDLPFSQGDIYYYGSASFDLQPTWTLGLTIGHYDFDTESSDMVAAGNPSDVDYTHYQLDIGKSAGDFGDFTFSVGIQDEEFWGQGDDTQVWVSWGKSF